MQKHRWTIQEDIACCEACYKYFIDTGFRGYATVENVVTELSRMMPDIKPSSIKMRLQNIKYLLDRRRVAHRMRVGSLENAAAQTVSALDIVLARHSK